MPLRRISKGLLLAALLIAQPALASEQADRIEVTKHTKTMTLFKGDRVLKRYHVALGIQPKGPKEQEGDGRTPEGQYTIVGRKPDSKFYRALEISYPNMSDRVQAIKKGVAPGGKIMIHGLANDKAKLAEIHYLMDWTDGCIAVTNAQMDEIWELVPDGTPIEILP